MNEGQTADQPGPSGSKGPPVVKKTIMLKSDTEKFLEGHPQVKGQEPNYLLLARLSESSSTGKCVRKLVVIVSYQTCLNGPPCLILPT